VVDNLWLDASSDRVMVAFTTHDEIVEDPSLDCMFGCGHPTQTTATRAEAVIVQGGSPPTRRAIKLSAGGSVLAASLSQEDVRLLVGPTPVQIVSFDGAAVGLTIPSVCGGASRALEDGTTAIAVIGPATGAGSDATRAGCEPPRRRRS
jgi:hypothetical protein